MGRLYAGILGLLVVLWEVYGNQRCEISKLFEITSMICEWLWRMRADLLRCSVERLFQVEHIAAGASPCIKALDLRRIDPIETASVLESDFLDFFEGHVAYFGELFGHFDEHSGIAARTSERRGCHVGAVGFEDDAVEGDICGDVEGFARVFERQDTRKTD